MLLEKRDKRKHSRHWEQCNDDNIDDDDNEDDNLLNTFFTLMRVKSGMPQEPD